MFYPDWGRTDCIDPGKESCECDLNGDGRVNLVDFSILLFYWGTNNECADQNLDGTVDLIDFSLQLTGIF